MDLLVARFSFLVDKCCQLPKSYPLVSVGCGAAMVEQQLRRMKLHPEIILVDPNPTSFMPRGLKAEDVPKMDYATTRDLLNARPQLRAQCSLLLWNPDPDFEYYDVEAIRHLAPRYIIIAYEANLSAGSYLLNAWLQTKFQRILSGTAISKEHIEKPHLWFPEESYDLIDMQEIRTSDAHGNAINRVVVLRMKPNTPICKKEAQFDASFKIYEENYNDVINAQRQQSKMLALIFSVSK